MKRQQLHPQCYISGVATLYPSGQQNGFLCSGRFSKMWVLELVFLLLVRDIYKRAFDEFKIRWIPPVPLVYPQPAGFFSLGCSLTKKNPAGPLASMLADWFFSRLYLFKSAWVAKKQAGPTRLFFCIPADLKRYSRLKNQSASIDASGSAGFFFVSEHPKEKKPAGWG